MSLQYGGPGTIPAETVRVARAAFPQGSVAMEMRDLLGGFVRDHDLDRVYLLRGRPVEAPWRMALVTVLQFREGLSDRPAADAVRSRIDGTYALSLELTDSGFDYSVLSAFRTRLVERGDGEERAVGDRLLREARWRGWLKERGVTVVGPVPADHSWQARAAEGFAVASFTSDWAARQATCPAGQASVTWQPTHDQAGHGSITISFSFARAPCAACPRRPSCTRSAAAPRGLTVRPRAEHDALRAARCAQDTDAFTEQYAARRDRRDHLPRDARLRSASRPLHGPGQDASPPSVHRGGDQRDAPGRLGAGDPSHRHAHLPFCPPSTGSVIPFFRCLICQQYPSRGAPWPNLW